MDMFGRVSRMLGPLARPQSGETGDHVSGHVTATRMPHLNGTEGIFVETAGLLELEGCGSEKRAECDLPRRAQVR